MAPGVPRMNAIHRWSEEIVGCEFRPVFLMVCVTAPGACPMAIFPCSSVTHCTPALNVVLDPTHMPPQYEGRAER